MPTDEAKRPNIEHIELPSGEHNHPLDQVKGSQFETCPTCKAMLAARRELVDLATPIYKARMCVDPFYKAREGAPLSWSSLVGSAVVVSRALVAYELGLATYQGTAAAPWTPRTEAL